jgi:hypothetical protein
MLENILGKYKKSCSAPHQESRKIVFAIFQIWMPLCVSEQEVMLVDQVFHLFALKIWNANVHESCVPQQTRQLS